MTKEFNLKEITDKLKSLEKSVVKAGLFFDKQLVDTRTTVAEYASYNEYGTATIPSRPFMRITYNENNKKWYDYIARQLYDLIDNKTNVSSILVTVGEMMASDIRNTINSNILPSNAPSTIKKKTRTNVKNYAGKRNFVSKTLIDTGIMRASVEARVFKSG